MMTRIATILYLLFLTIIPIQAQTAAKVKSFVLTTDHIPGAERRNDLNGKPCALVRIQVVDDITKVTGNKIGKIVVKGVEKRVYMCQGSRNMRLNLSNHLPVDLVFRDFGINSLEGNRVYEAVIEIPDAVPSAMPAATQKLILNYTPADAMVLIDSKVQTGSGRVELDLPIGEHDYTIAAPGYHTASGTVKIMGDAPRIITENLLPDGSQVPGSAKAETAPARKPDKAKEKKAPQKAKDKPKAKAPAAPLRETRRSESSYPQIHHDEWQARETIRQDYVAVNQQPQTAVQTASAPGQVTSNRKASAKEKKKGGFGRFFKKMVGNDIDKVVFRDGRIVEGKYKINDGYRTTIAVSENGVTYDSIINNTRIFMVKYFSRGNEVYDRRGQVISAPKGLVEIPGGASSVIYTDGKEVAAYDVTVENGTVAYNTEKKGKGMRVSEPKSSIFLITYPDDRRMVVTSIKLLDDRERQAEQARREAIRKQQEAKALADSIAAAEAAKIPSMDNPKMATIVPKKGKAAVVWIYEVTDKIIKFRLKKNPKEPLKQRSRATLKNIIYK